MSNPIAIRSLDLALSKETPRYWYGGDPFKTHFMNARSSTFPEGEAFFVRRVRHYRGRIDDVPWRRCRKLASGENTNPAEDLTPPSHGRYASPLYHLDLWQKADDMRRKLGASAQRERVSSAGCHPAFTRRP